MSYNALSKASAAGAKGFIDFATSPDKYRHWKLKVAGDTAELVMDVDENAGLFEGYQLKLNSCDPGVKGEFDKQRV
jgi:benzoyl-CoA-dihydrodiol lyase